MILCDGVCLDLIMCAAGKRLVIEPKATGEMRLRALEIMKSWTEQGRDFTPEMLALIDPACDVQLQMIDAAHSLNPKEPSQGSTMRPSFKILADSIEHFAKLNAGIRAALEWRAQRDERHNAATIE